MTSDDIMITQLNPTEEYKSVFFTLFIGIQHYVPTFLYV